MGDEQEQTQRVVEASPPPQSGGEPGAPATAATAPPPGRDITVPAADPFASTLTVAVGPAPAGPRLEPGRELGPVRLVREIGRGATGAVFHAHHTVLGRSVAVKFLINVTAGPGDAEGLRRFVEEARAAASVRHPNLTQVFHADLDGSTPYLVLEYVQGPTLRQLLDHAGELSVPVTAAILTDVASAVAELHARGIIHRDIKPSNVLVDAEGRVFVTDFGLALRHAHAPGHGAASAEIDFAGTPAYMAGEMFEGRVSSRSDVYAMGVMAFQLLAGATPFSGNFHELREKHLREPLPSEALRSRGVKDEVVEVIERAANKQAMFRYKTAPDFARALREAARCGMPELARARKRVCDLVAARASGAPPAPRAGGGAGSGATAEVRLPHRGAADDDSGSNLYTETISRIATVKRERRRNPPGDAEGSSTGLVAGGSSTQPAAGLVEPPLAAPAAPATDEARDALASPAVVPAAPVGYDPAPGPRTIPGPVLSVGVLTLVFGALAAVWQLGVLFGKSTNLVPDLPRPATRYTGVYVALVPLGIIHLLMAAAFVVAAMCCLTLKRWGRRFLVGLSVGYLALQVIVLLLALAWVEPVTVNSRLSNQDTVEAAASGRAALEATITRQWVRQWLTLSAFPAFVLLALTRRSVREAYRAASHAPVPEAGESEPLF